MVHKNTIMTLGLTIIACLAMWTMLLSFRSEGVVARPTSLPDAIMEDVIALTMDKQGKPKMKMIAPKAIHYAEGDTTHLNMPQLTLYRKSPQPWHITAKYAKAMQGVETVDFWDNVVIHHYADSDNPETIIKTTALRAHPEKQIAQTADAITMTQPNTIIHAVGMRADMNQGTVSLLSQARGEYVPTS